MTFLKRIAEQGSTETGMDKLLTMMFKRHGEMG
jgi:hypothetical protein